MSDPLHPFHHPRCRNFVPKDLWVYRAPRRLTQAELQAIVDGLASRVEKRTYSEAELIAEIEAMP